MKVIRDKDFLDLYLIFISGIKNDFTVHLVIKSANKVLYYDHSVIHKPHKFILSLLSPFISCQYG